MWSPERLWQLSLKVADNIKAFGALHTDLSKAFDCISHDLLIAKLHAYGLSFPALKLMQDYHQNRKQRTKVGTACTKCHDILASVPQGFILGFILDFFVLFCFVFFYYLGFLPRTFTNYSTAGEGGGHSFNSSLPLPPASQILYTLAGRLLQTAHPCTQLAAGLKPRTFGFRAQVTNHYATCP